MRERRVVVGMGANLGDRLDFLDQATARIGDVAGIVAVRRSPIIETEPVGGPLQGRYFNCALLIRTSLAPRALLEALLTIERDLGRTRDGTRDAPRTIDLDLLWIEGERIGEPDLLVPHPRLAARAFALVPLIDVAPDARDAAGSAYADLPASRETPAIVAAARDLHASD